MQFGLELLLLLPALITITARAFVTDKWPAKFSPQIVCEFKDFLQLIPEATIGELVAKHYIVDGDFREAFNYLKSDHFTELEKKVLLVPEVINILQFLHLLSDDINGGPPSEAVCKGLPERELTMTSNAVGPPDLEIVLLDAPKTRAKSAPYDSGGNNLGTFSGFVEELMQHLPRSSYSQMINEKRLRNAAFAEFYVALRSPEFPLMVDMALESDNLKDVIRTLSSNAIDVQSLKAIAFRVISWGPN